MASDFFSRWSAPMAYLLGYWFADGNIYSQPSCGGYTVSIGSKDVAHLELLRETIGLGRLTRITGSDVFKLVICRKAMYEDLVRLGGSERKSLTLTWPAVPDEYLAHFVRGYVDGDGCLSWHRPGSTLCPMITAVGTCEFLCGMAQAIQCTAGIPAPIVHPSEKGNTQTFRTAWYGLRAKCLAIWLYHQHSGLALDRKATLAQAFAEWHPRNYHPSKITAQMWKLFGEYLP